MKLFSSNKEYKLYHGNMLDMLEIIEPNSIDSIVTDPPYELGFMGKSWDKSGIAFQKETWEKCFEVLKPGGYLLSFGGSRTFHRIATAIEDAGFEIRDTIMWLYGSGFPKSMNIGLAIDKKLGIESEVVNSYERYNEPSGIVNIGQGERQKVIHEVKKATNEWNGWGTALKPAYEPIIVARKPFKGSLVDNVIEYGVGGINIDECRVETQDNIKPAISGGSVGLGEMIKGHVYTPNNLGRFPANTILTYDETDFEEVCGGFPNTKSNYEKPNANHTFKGNKDAFTYGYKMRYGSGYEDSGSAARYFYCAKASKKDRDEGLDDFELKTSHAKGNGLDRVCEFCGVSQLTPELCKCEIKSWVAKPRKNIHPTVKPTELMQYLVRLVTPNNGIVLDPFNGSGSTGKAVMYENKERNKNYKYIGIELTEEYLPIAKARIECVINKKIENMTDDVNKSLIEKEYQTSLF